MKNMNDILKIAGVSVVVLIAGLFVVKPTVVVNPVNAVDQVLGSASSPSVVGGCLDVNGVVKCSFSQGAMMASTTCAFPLPSATTTLTFLDLRVASSSRGATTIEFGKAVARMATTTLFGTAYVLADGAQGTINASTTLNSAIDGTVVMAPNNWVNVKTGGGIVGGNGSACKLEYIIN